MKSNKKGITLISTLIILIVFSVLAGTITISSHYIIENTREKEFVREYKVVESATKDYIMRNSGILDFEEVELDLSTINQTSLNQFDGESITDNKIDMYIVDLEKIGVTNTTYGTKVNGDEDDVYLVSKDTNTVYYKKGYKIDNLIKYKVTYD